MHISTFAPRRVPNDAVILHYLCDYAYMCLAPFSLPARLPSSARALRCAQKNAKRGPVNQYKRDRILSCKKSVLTRRTVRVRAVLYCKAIPTCPTLTPIVMSGGDGRNFGVRREKVLTAAHEGNHLRPGVVACAKDLRRVVVSFDVRGYCMSSSLTLL